MKAFGYRKSLPVDDPNCLEAFETDEPQISPRDLLVAVKAVSVNPVDVKVRMRAEPESGRRILGFDAAGVVEAVGSEVTLFRPGDAVYYAGDVTRPGSNAALQAVDERVVGHKPKSLGMAEAASLPLTAITAWEMLFDCFKLKDGDGAGDAILVIGAAGGVGSILIQLAKALTGLRVIATASRPDTIEWCRAMGADDVIDHTQPLGAQCQAQGVQPRYVAGLNRTDLHFDAMIELIQPRGEIALIDDPANLDASKIKQKSLSLHWEFMFARSMHQAADMDVQAALLDRVAAMVDADVLRHTMTQNLGALTAQSLIDAHRAQESGRAIGKTVLEMTSA